MGGCTAAQAWHVSCCTVPNTVIVCSRSDCTVFDCTSALLRLGSQSRPQVAQTVPFSWSAAPQQRETCRLTLPIETLVKGRHTHIQFMHLIDENYQDHAHAQSSAHSPTNSFSVQALCQALVKWGWRMGPCLRPKPSGIKQSLTHMRNMERGTLL